MTLAATFIHAVSVVSKETVVVRLALALIGFTAVVAQVVLMRDLIVVFSGNEMSLGIMLASWLLWTAAGSGVLGRLWKSPTHQRAVMACLELAVAVLFPITIWSIRSSKAIFQSAPGELLGPGSMMLTSFTALSLFCAASGWLFAAGARLYQEEAKAATAHATGSVYLLEAVGSTVGGCLASAALILHLTASQIALLVALLNLVAAAMLGIRGRRRRLVADFGILILATGLFPAGSRWLEAASLGRLWRGFHLLAVRDTLYGNLAVVETEGSRSLYENGLAVATQSDPEAAEEAVHFALLQHPLPRSLLLIGGGINGSVAEALKHSSLQQVDYVELDPGILEVGRRYFAEQWRNVADNPRVRIHNVDGRLYVKSTGQKFDVVIVNLPDPQTAQLNRFYTAEFFQEARRILQPGGMFSFQLTGAENYISPQLADFLRSVHRTLSEVFPQVRALPGARIHFFASKDQGAITEDPQDLIARLRMRGLKTAYVREYYLPFRMSKERMVDLASQLEPRPQTPVNRDFIPTAYYFNIALWSARFQGIWSGLFQSSAKVPFAWLLAGTILLWGAVSLLAIRNPSRTAAVCVASMGFTQIGLEVFLLLAFQALCGYVYHQLALIIAGFMAGMALGSWWALPRASSMRALTLLQVLGAVSALVLCALFRIQPLPGPVLFPVLALFGGVLGGYQFTMAGKIFHEGPEKGAGALYGIDLLGSVLGALLLSTFLIPIYGFFKTSLVIVAVNLVPAALSLFSWTPRDVLRQTPTR